MPKTTKRQAEVCELREQLNLGGMAAIFAEVALRAATEHLTHEASVWELAAHERDLRTQRRTARFPSIIQVHVERLKSGTFLESATNVVAVGRPGVGKSHVLAA
jgi:DNA replication protein DnaC